MNSTVQYSDYFWTGSDVVHRTSVTPCFQSLLFTIMLNETQEHLFSPHRLQVANIVLPNVHHFRSLYRPILAKEVHVRWHQEQNRFQQDLNHVTQFHHLQLLPKTVLLLLQERRTRPGAHPDLEEVLRIYANSSHCDECVAACLHHIVRRSSTVQALKAAVTAGGRKSVIYAMGKLKKMYISRKQVSNQCQ